MSGEDYIKLPNGKKIYLKERYGEASEGKFPKNSRIFDLFSIFNLSGYGKLNSNDVKGIFDSLKTFAVQDGNNELSMAELMGFVREHVHDDYTASMIKPKEVMKFFDIVQKESDKSLANYVPPHIENTINNIFPELNFLNIGKDDNIDFNRFSIEEIKKLYPSDKYEIKESNKTEYVSYNENGSIKASSVEQYPGFKERIVHTMEIINKETGKTVLLYSDDEYRLDTYNISFINESDDNEINIRVLSDIKNAGIKSLNDDRRISILDGKLHYAKSNGADYNFSDEGVLVFKTDDIETVEYDNGIEKRHIKHNEITNMEFEMYDSLLDKVYPEDLFKSINSNNAEELQEHINKTLKSDSLGKSMDSYYKEYGRELIDDIKNSEFPKDIKNKLLHDISYPYVESKFYDPNKKVENSRVDTDDYTSTDEYSIEYNGPIVNVFNRTTGKKIRLNLQTLLGGMEYRNKGWRNRSLKVIQSYSGEVLENLGIEVERIVTLGKKESKNVNNTKITAGGTYSANVIQSPTLHWLKGGIIVHEMGHAIDQLANGTYSSSGGNFFKVFNDCLKRFEASGHKRFDDMHPNASEGIFGLKGDKYPTYNEKEAFATCIQILFGYEDSHTKFIKKYMPELIPAARELYLEIRSKTQNERREIRE